MKKIFVIGLIIIFLPILTFSQTYIKNGEEVVGYWTKEGSPYICEGVVVVPDNKILVIEEGVTVIFKSGNDFKRYNENKQLNLNFDAGFMLVYGTLIARGKYNNKIKMTSNTENGQWGGIIFVKSKKNEIINCIIEKTHYIRNFFPDQNTAGALTFIESKGIVYNSIIKDAWSAINSQRRSKVRVINCVLTNNEYGIDVNHNSRLVLTNSIVWNNKTAFFVSPNCDVITESCILQEIDDEVLNSGDNIIGQDPKMNKDFTIDKTSIGYKKGRFRRNIGLDSLL